MGRYAPAVMLSECKYSALPQWIEEIPSKEISQGAKLCFGRLLGYARSNGYAFPPIKVLAKNLGVNHKQTRRYIHQLEEAKLIEIVYREGDPSHFYLIDKSKWHPKELKKTGKKTATDVDNKESKDLSTTLVTYDHTPLVTYDQGSSHIRPDPLVIYDHPPGHIRPDINNNKQLTNKITNKKQTTRVRAKGDVFDLFEEAGLDSEVENQHFGSAMETYPKNPHHRNLYAIQKLWVERRIDGFSSEKMLHGVKAYRSYCNEKNITGTQAVMSLGRFFGGELNFNNNWEDELRRYKTENNPYSRYEFHTSS